MTIRFPKAGVGALLALALALAGCANNAYLASKSYTASGGQMESDIATANSNLATAQQTNVQLKQDVALRNEAIERDARRINTLNGDLNAQDAQLKRALQAKKVSQSRHAELKRQLDSIRQETQNADLENQRAKMAKTPDPKADAAKEAHLRDLEKRKKDLDTALKALTAN
ncbi:hypothetical protein [Variovorax rhizosphaerae]|uniref:Lipoprotein n=1 Tax=Variovorax rhizosphaerae TaxID=1836200 RepID=A0ABU8WT98_9BURK